MKVPFVALGHQNVEIKEEILAAFEEILGRGDFVMGKAVAAFEQAFAARMGTNFAVGVNSGFDALFLTLRALKIGPGDEVITVPNTYVATVAAIALNGATPRFVDVGLDENIDVNAVENLINSQTKAILPVHLRGRPAAMTRLEAIAKRHNVLIIEDCAQSIDATFDGRKTGTFGKAGCFSLHPLKNLGSCGDAGIIITNDETLYQELRQLHNHGLKDRDLSLNPCVSWGFNSRLDSTAAAILQIKLKYLAQWTEERRQIASTYKQYLAHLPILLPAEGPEEKCVYHSFVIQTQQRDTLQRFLLEHDIETKIHYSPPLHLQPAAQELGYRQGDFPIAEQQSERMLSLPLYPGLSEGQVEYISTTMKDFFRDKHAEAYASMPPASISPPNEKGR